MKSPIQKHHDDHFRRFLQLGSCICKYMSMSFHILAPSRSFWKKTTQISPFRRHRESNRINMSFQPLGATSRHIPRLSQTYPLEVDNPNLGQTAGVILSMQSWKLLLMLLLLLLSSSVFLGCWERDYRIFYTTQIKYMICI